MTRASLPKEAGGPKLEGPPDVLKLTGAPASRPKLVTSSSILPGADAGPLSSAVPAVAGFDSVRNCGGMAVVGPQSVVAWPARTSCRLACVG